MKSVHALRLVLFLFCAVVLAVPLKVFAATFTPGMAKRTGALFAGAPIVQGKVNGSATGDLITLSVGSNIFNNFYANIDPSQGSIAFLITPEWNGNDNLEHYILLNTSGSPFTIFKSNNNRLYFSIGGANNVYVSTSAWTAGSTYSVVVRWDTRNTLNGTNYISIAVDDSITFGASSAPGTLTIGTMNIGQHSTGVGNVNSKIEGLTIYRRPLFDGTYGVDVGNGDEIAQIYNSGSFKDPTEITGSWDVVFALPTNASTGALSTGTGEAWSHPHSSNLLYTDSTNTGGFMMNGTYTSDGWTAVGTLTASSDSGSSLNFDGSNDFVSVPDDNSLDVASSMTISAWINPGSGQSTDAQIISKNGAYGIGIPNNTSLKFYFWGSDLSVSYTFIPGQWYHVAGVYDGSKRYFYVNGVLIGSPSSSDAPTSSGNLKLGYLSGSNHAFKGVMKDARIYNRALSSTEINETIYKTSLSAAEQNGLVGWWKMNEGSGQTVTDSSSSSNNGTLGADSGSSTDDPTWSTDTPVPTLSGLSTSEKVFNGGYKTTSSAANQGIYYDKTVTAGDDWVIRALGNSDGTCAPRVILYDQTNDAEIGHLDGTTSSTRTDPDVYIFTGEAPTGMTTLRVKLINTASSGTCYWHQVEVLNNIWSNPSVESGTGDPWIPTGWKNSALDSGDIQQETTTTHSGLSSVKMNTSFVDNGESIRFTPTYSSGDYLSQGGWLYLASGTSPKIGVLSSGQFVEQDGTGNYTDIITSGSWTHRAHVMLRGSNAGDMRVQNFGATAYFDDLYTFRLDPISLTVTPASEANSAESSGTRVDGLDTYTETVSEFSASKGYVTFDFTPRHSFSVANGFGSTAPRIMTAYADGSNFIDLYWYDATRIRLRGFFNGTEVDADWTPPTLDAGTTYTIGARYTSGGNLVLTVDGVEKASTSGVVDFSTTPTTFYMGSNSSGQQQYDATYDNLVFDSTAPAISLTTYSPDPTSDSTPTLTGTATDAIGTVASVEYQVDSTAGSWTSCTADDGAFDEASETFSCTTSTLSDGAHTVYVRATDSNGNTTGSGSEATDTFTIDSSIPSASVTAISPDPTTDSTPSITGTATDSGGTITNVQFQVDSTSGTWSNCTADDGTFDEASETFSCQSSDVSDGPHTIYVRATDNSGNESSNASDTFIVDTIPPADLELKDPESKSYTSDDRPSFKWKATTDATSGLSKYKIEIDNGDSGDFTIDDIPPSRTDTYEVSKYKVSYHNNYITVHTKSSLNWGSDTNDGKLKEGRRTWKVIAIDVAGNETSSDRVLFVDKTKPKVETIQVNNSKYTIDLDSIATTDKTPTISGKVSDFLEGDSDNKVASGPESVQINIEKKDGLGFEPFISYTLNFDTPRYTCTNLEVPDDNKENKCDKYLHFEYTPDKSLDFGIYIITINAADKANNSSSEVSFILNVASFDEIPTSQQKEQVQQEIKDLPKEEQEKVKDETELTVSVEPSILQKVGDAITNILSSLVSTIGVGSDIVSKRVTVAFGIGSDLVRVAVLTVDNAVDSALEFTGETFALVGEKVNSGLLNIGNSYNQLSSAAPLVVRSGMLAVGTGVSNIYQGASLVIQNTGKTMGSVVQQAGFAASSTKNAITLGIGNSVYIAKEHISNVVFDIGERTESISNQASVAIVKFGYLFATEPTQISNVRAQVLDSTTVKITWITNHPATGKVNWGYESGVYDFEVQEDKRTTEHEFLLTGLSPGTRYHYEVMSQNQNYVFDANREFQTTK